MFQLCVQPDGAPRWLRIPGQDGLLASGLIFRGPRVPFANRHFDSGPNGREVIRASLTADNLRIASRLGHDTSNLRRSKSLNFLAMGARPLTLPPYECCELRTRLRSSLTWLRPLHLDEEGLFEATIDYSPGLRNSASDSAMATAHTTDKLRATQTERVLYQPIKYAGLQEYMNKLTCGLDPSPVVWRHARVYNVPDVATTLLLDEDDFYDKWHAMNIGQFLRVTPDLPRWLPQLPTQLNLAAFLTWCTLLPPLEDCFQHLWTWDHYPWALMSLARHSQSMPRRCCDRQHQFCRLCHRASLEWDGAWDWKWCGPWTCHSARTATTKAQATAEPPEGQGAGGKNGRKTARKKEVEEGYSTPSWLKINRFP